MLSLQNIQKRYADSFRLNIPYLNITKGEIVGLVGNNGAGKSTILKLILDLIPCDEGDIRIQGYPSTNDEKWKSLVGAYLDHSFLIDFLTPEEYFEFIVSLKKGLSTNYTTTLDLFAAFFNNEILNKSKYIRDYSTGNQAKIGITSTFLTIPPLIILDEPFANLDPSARHSLARIIRHFQQQFHCTFLISSHDLDYLTDICNRCLLIHKGELVKDFPVDNNSNTYLKLHFAKNS